MRFLLLSQGHQLEDQPDFHESFKRAVGEDDYLNIPYQKLYADGGWSHLEKTVLEANESFKPDVIYFQFFHAPECVHPHKLLLELKKSTNRPLILGSLGDLFDTGLFSLFGRPLPPSIVELAAEADAFFSTSMGGTAEELVKKGGKNIVFLPNAYCPEHFPFSEEDVEKQYDVLMLGRVPRFFGRQPRVSLPTSFKRRYVVSKLISQFGERFAIFGYGWRGVSAHGGVPFKGQVDLFRKSRIVVDSPPRTAEEFYSSDRAYFIAGSGASLVMPYVPGFELLFEPDRHAYYVRKLRDVSSVCRHVLLLPDDVRQKRAKQTIEYIRSRNLISHRVDTIMSVIESISKQRSGEFSREAALNNLRLWHFRPELNRAEFLPRAVLNWRG